MHKRQKVRPAKLVSFSGIDGAGKSTQIEALCSRLRQAKQSVLVIAFWDDVACLTRFREATGHTLFQGDRGVGTPDAPIHRRDKNVRSWMMTLVRLGLYLLDAVALRGVARRAVRSGADVVVCDRYIYDEFANLDLRNPANRLYVALVMKVVPKPQIGYLLDADPVQARGRKPEYPIEFLRVNRASYLALSDRVGMTVIDAMPREAVERAVLQRASGLLFPAATPQANERRTVAQQSEAGLAVERGGQRRAGQATNQTMAKAASPPAPTNR